MAEDVSALDGERLLRRVGRLLSAATVVSHLVGAVVVTVIILVVVPRPAGLSTATIVANAVAVPIYVLAAIVVGHAAGSRKIVAGLAWLREDREPDPAEQRAALRAPLHLFWVQVALWTGGLALFTTLNGIIDPSSIPRVGFSIAAAGVVTCATAYLSSERIMRPVAARALSTHPPERLLVPGVVARNLVAWTVGSAVPIAGLMTIAIFALAQGDTTATQLSVAILALGGAMLLVGLQVTMQAARAAVDPIRDLRRALAEVESGDLDARVPVYDGSEIGLLQAGFNRMVAGLAERARLRDLFGRHVGEDVATSALERAGDDGVALGGEVRHVGVLFVDIVASTAMASERPPEEVVDVLNRFFGVVVDVVTAHDGFVNKFEGDGALAVFGAPLALDDPAGAALSCARRLRTELDRRVPDCRAGIGVSAGPAVAGNIGAERRFEYTVIGDPVNEAARLTELAKTHPAGVAAAAHALEAAAAVEAACWTVGEEVALRGRREPTVVAVPRDG